MLHRTFASDCLSNLINSSLACIGRLAKVTSNIYDKVNHCVAVPWLKTLVHLFYCALMPQSNGGCIGKSAFVFHYAGSEVRHLCMWGVRDEAQIFQETTASFRKKENLVLFDFPGLFWHVNSSDLEIKRWSLRELCWLNERFKGKGNNSNPRIRVNFDLWNDSAKSYIHTVVSSGLML